MNKDIYVEPPSEVSERTFVRIYIVIQR